MEVWKLFLVPLQLYKHACALMVKRQNSLNKGCTKKKKGRKKLDMAFLHEGIVLGGYPFHSL